ncbi:ABC transporter substrate-binding protein [Sporosarcina sp. G11-34]|uniref:ABC transporter substrate-binding protein n=1 Tax=Sporosarcina sp. G11-34 TaxID=2849605 RepID=UPI0022A8D502|nr:ABC transporter substrate-binding protein [Sporosarcina sp. G11-34]MCZ2260160.1 ABC transporter substrate-binding protein [Sporosarcina sp. G11-34]
MSRRRKINQLVSLLLIFSLVLAGCSSGGKTSAKTDGGNEEKEAVSGGELTYALATDPDTLDPHVSAFAVSTRVIKGLFETLVYQGLDNEIEPWLATEWEVSEDQKVYTFKLKEGVTFHDGTEFNADVVKYNFGRIFDPTTKALFAASYMEMLESVEVVNNYTVKFTLSNPSATFITLLAHSNFSIVSQEAAEKAGEQFGLHPVGTGPFQFVEAVENDRVVLEKNENYHGGYPFADHEGPAYLDKLTFKIVPEEATRIGSVQSGQIKAAETVPPQDILTIEKNAQLKLWEAESGGLPYTLFINSSNAPWDDVKARLALRASIDVGSIVKTLYLGTYERAWSPLTPSVFGYDASLEGQESFDVEKANALFDGLGWVKDSDGLRKKDGKIATLRILNNAVNREKRQDITLMVKEQLKVVGVDVQIETTSEHMAVLRNPTAYDAYGNSRVGNDPDDLRMFYHSEKMLDKGGSNIAWYNGPELDGLLKQGEIEMDDAKRADLYKEAQQILVNDVVSIPIYLFPYTIATSSDVQGIKFDSIGYPLFFDANITK